MKRRKTDSKQEVLSILREAGHTALNHEMIKERLNRDIDRVTIYRILNRFWEDKLVHRIIGDDGKQYFAYCSNCGETKHLHSHFHFRCTECGKVECLEKEVNVALPPQYVLQNFNGIVSGLCPQCAEKA